MNRFLKKELIAQIGYILSLVVLNMLLTLIVLAIPLIQGELVDVFVYSKSMRAFYRGLAWLIALTAVQLIVRYFATRLSWVKKEASILKLNQKILGRLFKSNTEQVIAYEGTYLHSRILQDSAVIIEFFYITVSTLASNLLLMFVASAILFSVNAYILLSLAVFIPVYLFIYWLFKEKLYAASKETIEAGDACFSVRNTCYRNYTEIKARKREEEAQKGLRVKESVLMACIRKNVLLNYVLSSVKIGTNATFQFLGFAIGGLAVLNGHMTLGVFTYVIQYFAMLLGTTEELLTVGAGYQKYKASLVRLNDVLHIQEDIDGEGVIDSVEAIEFNSLNYRYRGAERTLYRAGLTGTFESNNLYILLGENGVGKSTLFMLLTGVYGNRQLEGELSINGLPLEAIDTNYFRKNCVSIMLQQSTDIGLTVREYMSTVVLESVLEELLTQEAYKNVFKTPFFDLHEVWDKPFDVLSGGEKQLINLLACVSKKASLYLLDEPTAHVFPGLKRSVAILLEHLAESGTLVIVSTHEDALFSNAQSYRLG
ncbi:ATP-binding cassette domain-containing protein [Fusibacter sp. JL298sf-3]